MNHSDSLQLSPMKIALGADIGGTFTKIGSVSPDGRVVCRDSFRTTDSTSADAFADTLAEKVKDLQTETVHTLPPGTNVTWLGLGIGAPNGIHHSGCIQHPPNLPAFPDITPLVKLMKARLDDLSTVVLDNDANAAAMGEKLYGAARDYSDFIMITLGTGLGSGVYVNDTLVRGANGLAGEIGHVTVIPDGSGRYCGFGRRGSLETYCSATGIRRTFFERLAVRGCETKLDAVAIGQLDAKQIGDAARDGDPVAEETMTVTGRTLGQALASVALVTNPAAFVLFGGPVQAGRVLLDPVRQSFAEHLIPPYANNSAIQILESTLPEADAAILGAAALVTPTPTTDSSD